MERKRKLEQKLSKTFCKMRSKTFCARKSTYNSSPTFKLYTFFHVFQEYTSESIWVRDFAKTVLESIGSGNPPSHNPWEWNNSNNTGRTRTLLEWVESDTSQLDENFFQLCNHDSSNFHSVFDGFIVELRNNGIIIDYAKCVSILTWMYDQSLENKEYIFVSGYPFSKERWLGAVKSEGQIENIAAALFGSPFRIEVLVERKGFNSLDDFCPIILLSICVAAKFIHEKRGQERIPIFDDDDPSHWMFPTSFELGRIKAKLTEVGLEKQSLSGFKSLTLNQTNLRTNQIYPTASSSSIQPPPSQNLENGTYAHSSRSTGLNSSINFQANSYLIPVTGIEETYSNIPSPSADLDAFLDALGSQNTNDPRENQTQIATWDGHENVSSSSYHQSPPLAQIQQPTANHEENQDGNGGHKSLSAPERKLELNGETFEKVTQEEYGKFILKNSKNKYETDNEGTILRELIKFYFNGQLVTHSLRPVKINPADVGILPKEEMDRFIRFAQVYERHVGGVEKNFKYTEKMIRENYTDLSNQARKKARSNHTAIN